MEDHDDLNSSDIEMPAPQRPNPHAQLGRASIEAMMKNALGRRVQSKIKSNNLTNVLGAPGSQTERSRWANRFSAFCEGILKHKPGTIPVDKDIERFLFEIVGVLQGRVSQIDPENSAPSSANASPSPEPSFMVQSGLQRLLGSLRFDHAKFQLDNSEQNRIASVLEQLHQEGKLTKDPKRENLWLGAFIVHKLANSTLEDALKNGTLSWDIVLSKALSIVLTAALITRAGDIARNSAYKELQCMLHEHITLKVVTIDGVEFLQGLFSVYNEKGKKNKRKEARKVPLSALMSSKFNVVCPVALIVILAMRRGIVESTNIEDLLQRARARQDKTVVWLKPKMPVLCGINIHTHQLMDSPAPGIQLLHNVRQASELAGIVEEVITHDIRRGGFRDLANLKTPVGGRLEGVTETAGHSASTRFAGVTKQYVGYLKADDTWKKRLEENTEHEAFGVTVVGQPFKKRRLDSKPIDDYCKEHELDATDTKVRDKVRAVLRKQAKDKWAEEGIASSSAQTSTNQIIPVDAPSSTTLAQSASRPNANIGPELLDTMDFGQDELEPSEEAQTQTLSLLVDGLGIKDPEEFALGTGAEASNFALLSSEPYGFINTFARINVVRSLKSLDKTIFIISGGSKDEPSRFKFPCPNSVFGCESTSYSTQELGWHVQTCTLTSEEKHQEFLKEEKRKKFHCDREGCDSKFGTKKDLNYHKKKIHDTVWVDKLCDDGECAGSTKVYKNKSAWLNHRRNYHGSYKPQACQVPNCECKTVYDKRESLFNHLRKVHGLKGDAAKAQIL